jgi:hypothetical protein
MRQPDTLGDDPAQGAGTAAAWERRGEESAPAYRAFRAYLELGPDRALRPVAEAAGCHLSLIKRWSAKHDWRLRVRAWEERQRREAVAQETVQQAAYERRLHNAEQLERFAMAGLRSLVVRDAETGELRFDARLKPAEIAALIRVACQMLPTPPAPAEEEDGAPGPLAGWSEADLRALRAQLQGEEDHADPETA